METSLYLNNVELEKVKKCPSCRSIYITDSECEACGLQFNYCQVGNPYGPKSYYGIMQAQNKLALLFSPMIRKELTRKLFRRYRELTKYFMEGGDKQYRLFQLELSELLSELLKRKFDGEKLLDQIDSRSALYQIVGRAIFENDQRSSLFFRLFSYRILGGMRLSALLVGLFCYAGFIMASLAYFRIYFAIR